MKTAASVFTIDAVELGRRTADTSMFLYLTEPGVPIEIAYRVWLLRNGARTILVDTGPPCNEGVRRGLSEVRDVGAALATLGVDAARIDTILLTHLHWDHAANAEQFPNATFFAQKSEIEFFRSARRQYRAIDRFFSHQAYLGELIEARRIVAFDGDVQIEPGLQALRVGGHTPGSQMFAVATAQGAAVITGDAIPLLRNYVERIPSGILVDVFEALSAIERVAKLAPGVLYPAHDVVPSHRF